MRVSGRKSVLALLAATAMAPSAHADTLREALASAYNTNPTLQAARADQRAEDENVPIRRADGLPDASAAVAYEDYIYQSSNSPLNARNQLVGSVDLGVPVYSGGAVRNGVKAAKTRVKAGQAELRATESSVFSQVVAAYMDVIQNEAIVGLSGNLVDVLSVNLRATSDRFEIGDLTRTDVAQSQSRFELSRGDLRSARANLVAARERYIELVGHEPGDLEPPPPLPNMPEDASSAVATALEYNPDLIAAQERSRAADIDIRVAGAGRMPRVELFTGADYSRISRSTGGATGLDGAFPNTSKTASAGIRATIPLFQGGRPAAQQRQAQAIASATVEREIAIERNVIAQVRSAFSSWQAANALIESSQSAIDAASLSLEGVRAENTVGNRTILDILDAERELLSARVELVTARRNAYVAGFTLLAAMGRAEARDLSLETGGPLYDPMTNYKRVKSKIWDWDRDPDPEAQSTRTVDTAAQDGEIPE